jgi:hypothetical protein
MTWFLEGICYGRLRPYQSAATERAIIVIVMPTIKNLGTFDVHDLCPWNLELFCDCVRVDNITFCLCSPFTAHCCNELLGMIIVI